MLIFVLAGSLFIALDGATVDGHDYVNKAVEAGAVAVLVSKPVEISSDVCVITVEDTRAAMMVCVPYFFDYSLRNCPCSSRGANEFYFLTFCWHISFLFKK